MEKMRVKFMAAICLNSTTSSYNSCKTLPQVDDINSLANSSFIAIDR